MKTITLQLKRSSLFLMLITLFCFASCSKQTAYISQQQELAYEQNVAPKSVETTLDKVNIAQVDNTIENIAAPKTILDKVKTDEKATSHKKHRNAFASVNSIKEKAPKALKNLSADKLANVTLLASATKGKVSKKMEGGSYLKIGIVLILIGLLVGIIFSQLGYIISVIGVIFLILWLIDYL